MRRLFTRAAVVLAAVAVVGVAGTGSASAGVLGPATIDPTGPWDAYYGVSDGTGWNFTPGGWVSVYLYAPDQSYRFVNAARVVASPSSWRCTRFNCVLTGGDIVWHMDAPGVTCNENLLIYAVDESTGERTDWVLGVNYCYTPGG